MCGPCLRRDMSGCRCLAQLQAYFPKHLVEEFDKGKSAEKGQSNTKLSMKWTERREKGAGDDRRSLTCETYRDVWGRPVVSQRWRRGRNDGEVSLQEDKAYREEGQRRGQIPASAAMRSAVWSASAMDVPGDALTSRATRTSRRGGRGSRPCRWWRSGSLSDPGLRLRGAWLPGKGWRRGVKV